MSLRHIKKLTRAILEAAPHAAGLSALEVPVVAAMIAIAARQACAEVLRQRGERLDADLYWDNVEQVAAWLLYALPVLTLFLVDDAPAAAGSARVPSADNAPSVPATNDDASVGALS